MKLAALNDLEAKLNEPLPVGGRLRLLNEVSEALYERDAARGAALAREAIGLARAAGERRAEAQAHYCLARNLHSQADYPAVLEAQDASIALFRALGDLEGEARCLNLLGITWRQLSDYRRALEMYEAALRAFRQVGDRKWQARVISNIGNIEIQLGNHGAALELFEQALALRREIGDNEGAGFDLNNAAFAHVQRALQLRAAGDTTSCQVECETAVRQLDERLASMLRDARARGAPLTLALVDVDHFKGINDRFSHAVGDEVLRCVGEILRAHCRAGDFAGRYGGEEFVLVFRGLEMAAAAQACERVRRSVEEWDWKSIHPQLRVTLSMGLASSRSFDEPQGLLDAADHWLREAKHHGRNQVQPMVVAPVIPA